MKINDTYGLPGAFTPVFDCVMDDKNISGNSKLLYCLVARRSLLTGQCAYSRGEIADQMGLTLDEIKGALAELYKMDYLRTNGCTNRYWRVWCNKEIYREVKLEKDVVPMRVMKSDES